MQASNIIAHRQEVEALQHGTMCAPIFADLHLSNVCNQRCKGCAYQDNMGKDTISYMSLPDIRTTINRLAFAGVKAFDFAGGGEPLCIRDIRTAFSYVIDHNCAYALITNGLLFEGDLMKQVIDEAAYVRISLEASILHAYEYYKQCHHSVWDKVLDNIRKAIMYRNLTGSTCEIGIKFSVSKSLRGRDHYRAGIELGKRLGVNSIQFKALRHEPEELNLTEKNTEAELLSRIVNACGVGDLIRYWIVPESDIPQCWLSPLHIVVDHNGDCYICCYYYYRGAEHKIGNILDTPFDDFWYSEKHKEQVAAIDRSKCELVDCKFFRHHAVVKWAFDRKRAYWL